MSAPSSLALSSAPKGRNIIACGNATGDKPSSLSQALKGRNIYVALSGLNHLCVSLTQGVALGYHIAPLWGLGKVQRWGRTHLKTAVILPFTLFRRGFLGAWSRGLPGSGFAGGCRAFFLLAFGSLGFCGDD
jgi:hypothetical protein